MKPHHLTLFNSISGNREHFVPKNPEHVGIYVCGPTTYARPHLGNLRSAVIYDVLYRLLQLIYPKVTYVRNITDIDDKIIFTAQEQGCDVTDLSERIIREFHHDMQLMNCLQPTKEPKVTDHLEDIISMIEKLVDKGHAYVQDESDTIFSAASDPEYGNLSKRELEKQIAGIRVSNLNKMHANDFVLWKKSPQPHWTSPFGVGRPGWHIECSAMSNRYLKDDSGVDIFDIHGGGVDLKFPHHENELAQSRCAQAILPKYWVHNGFLLLEGEKMSKSLGNTKTLENMIQEGWTPEILRWALLNTHYRKPLNLTGRLLDNARDSIEKFHQVLRQDADLLQTTNLHSINLKDIPTIAMNCLLDDLNMPRYSAVMFGHLKDIRYTKDTQSRARLVQELYNMGVLIGIFNQLPPAISDAAISSTEKTAASPVLEQMITERNTLRKKGDFAKADELRQKLYHLGFIIEDKPDGSTQLRARKD